MKEFHFKEEFAFAVESLVFECVFLLKKDCIKSHPIAHSFEFGFMGFLMKLMEISSS